MDSFTESGATVRCGTNSTAIGDDKETINNYERVEKAENSGNVHNVIIHGNIKDKDGRIFKFIDTSKHRLQDNKLAKNTTYFNDQGQRLIYNFNKRTWSVQ